MEDVENLENILPPSTLNQTIVKEVWLLFLNSIIAYTNRKQLLVESFMDSL